MMIGRRVYGLAGILMGAAELAFCNFAAMAHPAPGHFPTMEYLGLFSDLVLIAGGIAMSLGRRIAGIGAIALAALFVLMLALQFPAILKGWTISVTWEEAAEPTAMAVGALCAWSLLGEGDDAGRAQVARIARIVFGLCLIAFGISHFAYLKYTATLVPAWLPPSQIFWARATGVVHIAAGLAILSGVQARLGAVLLTAMFVTFGLLVWLPATIHDPHRYSNWSETTTTWLLVAAAWCVADSLANGSRRG
jgi:uncharacterized membrane protein YphA (DoxX/SURF4 family)